MRDRAEAAAYWFCDLPSRLWRTPVVLPEDLPQDALLIDVRSPRERHVSMLPGAITLDEVTPEALQGGAAVTYCTIGFRSGWAARRLRRRYQLPVLNLRGGVVAWALAGRQFVGSDKGTTDEVHVMSRWLDVLPEPYRARW